MTLRTFNATLVSAQLTGLTATATSSTTVNVSWNAYPGATAYQVRRNGTLIATPTGTTYSNSGHTAGTSYTYAVRPVVGGSGVASAQASIVVTTVGGAFAPNIAALPEGVPSAGDYANFPGTSWAINTPYTDTTGVVLRRITNASSPVSASFIGMTYATGGPRISRPFDDAGRCYWILVHTPAGAPYVGKYRLGSGLVSGSWFAVPVGGPNLEHAFSQNAAEPHILYCAAAGGTIHRYDVNARAYASNAVFSGSNASVSAGGSSPGWLQQNWSGSRMVWQTPYGGPSAVHHLNMTTGVRTTYNGTALSGLNEPKIFKGEQNLVAFAGNNNLLSVWFVDSNRATAYAAGTRTGHSDAGESTFYSLDPDISTEPLALHTPGNVPATDGAAWTGTRTNRTGPWTGGSNNHPSMAWDQTGAGASEWYCTGQYLQPLLPTLGTWTVHSGAIYRASVTFAGYGDSSRGINVVLRRNATQYLANMPQATSLAGMTVNSWWYAGGVLYVWMPDGSNPSTNVLARSHDKLTAAIGYIRADGSTSRKLCHTYRNESQSDYYSFTFANWSPDGLLVAYNSNLGTTGGRWDVVVAEVPRI